MTTTPATTDRELVLTRLIDAPREKLYRCWTEPALMKQWFAPKPYETPVVEVDVRPGGANLIVMRGPDGQDMPNRGIYLEVVPNERLVFTDAFTEAWQPSAKPFMTVILTFEPQGPRRSTPRASATGRSRIARRTRRWLPPGLGYLHRPARRACRDTLTPGTARANAVGCPVQHDRGQPPCPLTTSPRSGKRIAATNSRRATWMPRWPPWLPRRT